MVCEGLFAVCGRRSCSGDHRVPARLQHLHQPEVRYI